MQTSKMRKSVKMWLTSIALAIASAVKLSKNYLFPFNVVAVINNFILDNFLPVFAPTLSSISLIICIFIL